jgi:hypothetical protein
MNLTSRAAMRKRILLAVSFQRGGAMAARRTAFASRRRARPISPENTRIGQMEGLVADAQPGG